ncbi:hypothetical protein RBB50_010640 [Rhinocladiella similis]
MVDVRYIGADNSDNNDQLLEAFALPPALSFWLTDASGAITLDERKFCLTQSNTIQVVNLDYNECAIPLVFRVVAAPTSTTSTSTSTTFATSTTTPPVTTTAEPTTTVEPTTTTTTSFDPSGDLDLDQPTPTPVRRGIQYGGRKYYHHRRH